MLHVLDTLGEVLRRVDVAALVNNHELVHDGTAQQGLQAGDVIADVIISESLALNAAQILTLPGSGIAGHSVAKLEDPEESCVETLFFL